jgi:hypothetical protein
MVWIVNSMLSLLKESTSCCLWILYMHKIMGGAFTGIIAMWANDMIQPYTQNIHNYNLRQQISGDNFRLPFCNTVSYSKREGLSQGSLQCGQDDLSDKWCCCKCRFRLLASFLIWQWIYDNKYRGTILDYPFVILSHIATVSSLVRYDSGMVCLPQQSPVLLLIYLRQDWTLVQKPRRILL